MKSSKLVFAIGVIGLIHLNLNAQPTRTSSNEQLTVEKIIYHSSHCNGTCPQIDLEIDSNGNIFLKREFWKGKGVTDKHRSGNIEGKIGPKTYFNLVANLIASDFTSLKFPPIFCCDGIITTIIIYANGKRTILKSMTPPEKARKLISALYDIGTHVDIPPTTKEIKLEEE